MGLINFHLKCSPRSFDMWLTFRQMRVSQRRATSGPGAKPDLGWRQKRFKWYALYSWGCPFLISLVTGEWLLLLTSTHHTAFVGK